MKRTAAELRAMKTRGEVKTDWKAAARKPLPSGRDADDAMDEIDWMTTLIDGSCGYSILMPATRISSPHRPYSAAMKDLGVKVTATDMAPVKLTEGVFEPKNAEKYATSFPIHNLQG